MKRASGSTSSRGPGRQKKRQRSSKSSGAPSSWATTWGSPSSGRKLVKAPSACSTASSSILPRRAASTIGISWAGFVSSLKRVEVRSPASATLRNSSVSRTLESGFSKGIWFQPSMIRSEEEPMPSTKRPSEASDSAAASWASSAGPRWKTPTIPVPRRIRSVHAALRASGVKPSGPAVSPLQRSVYPAASARLTYSPCCASGTPVSGSVRPQRPSTRRPYRVRAPMPAPTPAKPDRNLALELVRVTEAAALAAARWVGRGDKLAADGAAVDAMRFVLDSVSMDGIVVIGEGEKDEAPMLFNGEKIGDGSPPQVDIAVDPLEGTTLAAMGGPNALAVIALSPRGTMFDPGPCVYMEKLAGGEQIADLLDLDRPLPETLKLIAERKGGSVGDVIVVMLDRPRHQEAMREVREAGARIRLITDGDVSAALLAVNERTT